MWLAKRGHRFYRGCDVDRSLVQAQRDGALYATRFLLQLLGPATAAGLSPDSLGSGSSVMSDPNYSGCSPAIIPWLPCVGPSLAARETIAHSRASKLDLHVFQRILRSTLLLSVLSPLFAVIWVLPILCLLTPRHTLQLSLTSLISLPHLFPSPFSLLPDEEQVAQEAHAASQAAPKKDAAAGAINARTGASR